MSEGRLRNINYLLLKFIMVKMDRFNVISHNFETLNEDLLDSLSVRLAGKTLFVFVHGRESWNLTLRAHKLRVFKNKALTRMFQLKK